MGKAQHYGSGFRKFG